MSWSHVIEAFDLLDSPHASGEAVAQLLRQYGADEVFTESVVGPRGTSDVVRVKIPGTTGKEAGGSSPSLGVIGRLGGLGARPTQIGFVSDGDGALAAVAAAAKLLDMARRGDRLDGDVIIATQIDPDAATHPHEPVPFMKAALEQVTSNIYEVSPDMDAILSIDTSKGNRICNHRGFAITPTVKEGWILRVSESLIDCVERASNLPAVVLPITTQDITPYGNGIHHVNSIMQASTATGAPVVGVALTSVTAIAGSATGATDLHSVDGVVRFVVETAKDFGRGTATFYDAAEFESLVRQYGSLAQLFR